MSAVPPSDNAPKPPAETRRTNRNGLIALICASVFVGMVGAAYASVPLYKAFCQLTGYGGTVRRAKTPPKTILDQTVEVRFDTNVRDLPWTFEAEQRTQRIRIGDQGLAFFKVTNNGKEAMTGRALFNVTPEQAAPYFQKLECFCFKNQTLKPGETATFPVVYFVDTQYAKDFNTAGQGFLTLSYTYFKATDGQPGEAKAGDDKKTGK